MARMVFCLSRRVKVQIKRLRRECNDKALSNRCTVVLMADRKRNHESIREATGYSLSNIGRVIARFRAEGVPGLIDHREDNGQVKLDDYFLSTLRAVVNQSPLEYGYHRPTWTLELFVKVMQRKTGVKLHRSTMGRALGLIDARWGRPKPIVGCPWSLRRKNRHLAKMRRTIDSIESNEVAVYLDEVDIHLNPKIGPDWMNCGKQKTVLTPGQNTKRYVCGALDHRTRKLTWVCGEKKNSLLFIDMLKKLKQVYADAKTIHVILDNFKIHDSKASRAAVASYEGKINLHFLPPYCPDDNKIERTWLDLHANVTRNHRCRSMEQLMREVIYWLRTRKPRSTNELRQAA